MAMSNMFDTYRRDGQRVVLTAWNPILWIFAPLYVLAKCGMIVGVILVLWSFPPFSIIWELHLGNSRVSAFYNSDMPVIVPYFWIVLYGEHLIVLSVSFAVTLVARIPLWFTAYSLDGNLADRIDERFAVVIIYGLLGIGIVGLVGIAAFLLNAAVFHVFSMFAFMDWLYDMLGFPQSGLPRERFWKVVYNSTGMKYTFPLAAISPIAFGLAGLYFGWRSLINRE